jgi:uncharacterized membrane protein YhaH (DUF805 family)
MKNLKLFSFDGRIKRAEYIVSFIITLFFINIINEVIKKDGYGIIALGYIPCYWILISQGAKRCHDLGKNGWWQIIPLYVLVLLIYEGDVIANKYD